jgi:ATP-dependent RNA helicase DeaD
MPKPIRKVADRYLTNPKEVRIESDSATAAHIEQHYLIVNGFERKLDAITRILESQEFDAIIIFVRTKTATAELAEKLEARGYSAGALNGDMNQALRERTISRLKGKQLDIIVATDVAARGIDVERVSHVINFDIPYDSEAYVHRIGRTGRAGRSGKAILLVAPREKRLLQTIERSTRTTIAQMEIPSGSEVSDNRIIQFKQRITEVLESQELTFIYEMLSEYSTEADRSAEEIASALAYMLQKERPLQVVDVPSRKPHRETSSADPRRDQNPRRPRQESPERGPRRERTESAERSPRTTAPSDVAMARYRIEVGRNQDVKPGDIVGAIANEAQIDSKYIGHIKLHDDHSTVELPGDMPEELMAHLKKVTIRSKAIELSSDGKAEPERPSKPKIKGKINATPQA